MKRVTDNRRLDGWGRPLKWCPRCSEFKRTELFGGNTARSDGLSAQCRRCMTRAKAAERSLDRGELAHILAREKLTDPMAVDAWDLEDRRREIRKLGADGIGEIRRRLEIMRRLKRRRGGDVIPDDVIDRDMEHSA